MLLTLSALADPSGGDWRSLPKSFSAPRLPGRGKTGVAAARRQARKRRRVRALSPKH